MRRTLSEVVRCTKAGITINTFMLDPDRSLQGFVEQMSRLNRGRAFFTNPENLGDYVLVDFLEHRRSRSSRFRRSRPVRPARVLSRWVRPGNLALGLFDRALAFAPRSRHVEPVELC